MALLSGSDYKAYAAYKEKFFDDGLPRFLDGQLIEGEKISYQTFPRSGSTFLRKYLELVTGIPTGSEMALSETAMF